MNRSVVYYGRSNRVQTYSGKVDEVIDGDPVISVIAPLGGSTGVARQDVADQGCMLRSPSYQLRSLTARAWITYVYLLLRHKSNEGALICVDSLAIEIGCTEIV